MQSRRCGASTCAGNRASERPGKTNFSWSLNDGRPFHPKLWSEEFGPLPPWRTLEAPKPCGRSSRRPFHPKHWAAEYGPLPPWRRCAEAEPSSRPLRPVSGRLPVAVLGQFKAATSGTEAQDAQVDNEGQTGAGIGSSERARRAAEREAAQKAELAEAVASCSRKVAYRLAQIRSKQRARDRAARELGFSAAGVSVKEEDVDAGAQESSSWQKAGTTGHEHANDCAACVPGECAASASVKEEDEDTGAQESSGQDASPVDQADWNVCAAGEVGVGAANASVKEEDAEMGAQVSQSWQGAGAEGIAAPCIGPSVSRDRTRSPNGRSPRTAAHRRGELQERGGNMKKPVVLLPRSRKQRRLPSWSPVSTESSGTPPWRRRGASCSRAQSPHRPRDQRDLSSGGRWQ